MTNRHQVANTARNSLVAAALVIFLSSTYRHVWGQEQPPVPDMVKLDVSGQMDLVTFIEFVAKRVGTRFVYDSSILQKKVNIIAPDPIPASSLLEVLQSILRTEGLVLADGGVANWKRIVPLEKIPEVASPSDENTDLSSLGSAAPVTRVFRVQNVAPTKIAELILPSMSKGAPSVVSIDEQNILIVTDIAENVRRVAQLIELLDRGKPLVDVKFVPAQFVKAELLAERLSELLNARAKALGRKTDEEGSGVEVTVDERANRIILVGNVSGIAEAEELLKRLDQSLPSTPSTLNLRYTSPEQLDQILRRTISDRIIRPPYQSRIEGNALVIETTPEIVQLAEQIKAQIDTREAPDGQSPIRFYKVKNVPAQELLQTIQSIFSNQVTRARQRLPERSRTDFEDRIPGPNYPPIFGGPFASPYVPLPQTPAMRQGEQIPLLDQTANNDTLVTAQVPAGEQASQVASELIGDAQVTVDIHTNTIIVVAKPEVQRIYAGLIDQLDERRPQVLVEAKIVIIDTSKDYTLGVEVSGGDRSGAKRAFAFTSFGFSQVDPVSGALQIIPGVGFNGTLVDPATADVVVRAVSTNRRARVLSSPRILVNDNAQGELTSVLEIPFTSVNASQTVATTSFAGFAQAGTTITVTPTISDDNYLQLDYVLTLNTFTGDGANGVPPPRQTNEVSSRVTVPDGYTVIVGGLTSKNDIFAYRGLPWLEKIPVVRQLTGTTNTSGSQTSLFVFLRPVILREDKFKDLKYLSDAEMCDARLPGEYPALQSLSIP